MDAVAINQRVDNIHEQNKLKKHIQHVNSASFSPDGKHIVTASADKTARVWDIEGKLIVAF
ncbi:MAG: WD40 repeat domain-containing protein [Nostoc sp.]|uniref:WD40 repeat domain-containing protein n=1 Tax=Nostoc sp. TaxID=1180 RepID=UPI002FF1E908